MTDRYFVDANVFVYARDPRDRAKQARADLWIRHLFRERIGRTSVQVLSEVYSVMTRKLMPRVAPEHAWDLVRLLMQWDPLPVDTALLVRARDMESRWRISWWDALIVAAAEVQGCTILLTEDLQDGAVLGSVTVRSPFTMELREPAAAYVSAPVVASTHRPRGRPRRVATA